MVAGPDGPDNRARIHGTPGPRWFAEDRPIRRVHGDASMFVGGLRALLLQSLHPLAMAGVAEHSDYRGDPWGRLQRTSTFLAVTTFGPAADAQRAVDKVRGIHRRVSGCRAGRHTRTRRPIRIYSNGCTSPRSTAFCSRTSATGRAPLDQAGRDGYVADTARVAEALGVPDPPRTEQQLQQRICAYRPELRGTAAAQGRGPLPLVDPATSARGAGTLRCAGGDSCCDAAPVGARTSVAALCSAGRGHRHQDGGQRRCRRDPMGDGDSTGSR